MAPLSVHRFTFRGQSFDLPRVVLPDAAFDLAHLDGPDSGDEL